jgi:hypothetical protein
MVCNDENDKKKVSSPQEANQTMQRKGVYIGESSRSLFERTREHYRDARDMSEKSHMVKHWLMDHADLDKQPLFQFKITGQFKDCLSRQVSEAIKILYSKDTLLNSKSEYLANNISRITIEDNIFEKKKKEKIEAEVERLEKEMMEKFRKEKTGKKTSSDMNMTKQVAVTNTSVWTKKKRRLLDEDHVQRKRRRIIPDGGKIDNVEWLVEGWRKPDPMDGEEFLDDWTAWWDWVTEDCSIISRLSDFRRFLEFDKARVLRRMECLEVDVIIADVSVWWKHLDEQIQHEQTPACKLKAPKKNKFQYQRDGREKRDMRKKERSRADWSLKLCGWNIWWKRMERVVVKSTVRMDKTSCSAQSAKERFIRILKKMKYPFSNLKEGPDEWKTH